MGEVEVQLLDAILPSEACCGVAWVLPWSISYGPCRVVVGFSFHPAGMHYPPCHIKRPLSGSLLLFVHNPCFRERLKVKTEYISQNHCCSSKSGFFQWRLDISGYNQPHPPVIWPGGLCGIGNCRVAARDERQRYSNVVIVLL